MQYGKSATWKECNVKKFHTKNETWMKHGKNETWTQYEKSKKSKTQGKHEKWKK